MDLKKVKEGFWVFECPCGASTTIQGSNIPEASEIVCQNCKNVAPIDNIKKAYESYLGFYVEQFKMERQGKTNWKMTPPA